MATTAEQVSPWLEGRSFSSWQEEFDRRGYLIFERVLAPDRIADIRAALAPHLASDLKGRNDFEGTKTNRVYALLAKSPLFAELVIHPLALAFAEAELGQSCQLSALLAINLQPGETVQPWHFDDSGAKIPRPRPALGVSTFWAIDDTTELNGATEIIPGSHLWEERNVEGAVKPADFTNRAENMCLAVPAAVAEKLPERARELIGYSIHPPFMRHVNGLHPRRLLHAHAT